MADLGNAVSTVVAADTVDDSRTVSQTDEKNVENMENDKAVESTKDAKKKKVCKPGIVYLSTIPPGMNPEASRSYFSAFGDVGRIYFEEITKFKKSGKRRPRMHIRNRIYKEGWIEFKKKSVAKAAAQMVNNQPVGGHKRKKYRDYLWNVKYLSRVKWIDLKECLVAQNITKKQRLHAEIAQAKRETDLYVNAIRRHDQHGRIVGRNVKQRRPMNMDESTGCWRNRQKTNGKNVALLKSVFGGQK